MNLKELLKQKQAELVALKSKIADGDEEALTAAGEIVDEIESLENKIKAADKANAMLKSIGSTKEEDNHEPTVKSGMKAFMNAIKAANRNAKGWSATSSFSKKDASDVINSVQIADVDRSVAAQPRKQRLADYLSQASVSGNAITYFVEGAVEGDATIVAEGGKKPQISTTFEPKTEALSKIAAYSKITDELADDNDFLESEVRDLLVNKIVAAENALVVSRIDNTTGIGTGTYTANDVLSMMDAVLKAKADIAEKSNYEATIVIMNPTDVYTMQTARDKNGQYYGGGFLTGAYGNGAYASNLNPWGLSLIASSNVTAGTIYVLAGDAVRMYRKNDVAVRLYDQNEDDAIYNRLTLLAEERALPVVKAPGAVVKITTAA